MEHEGAATELIAPHTSQRGNQLMSFSLLAEHEIICYLKQGLFVLLPPVLLDLYYLTALLPPNQQRLRP